MEPSKEAIAVRVTRLNRQILGKVIGATSKLNKRILDRETLLDALTVLYDDCNDDPVKKSDELVRSFVDKYRSTLADLRRTRVCLSDFDILQSIGRGHFGEVHMVREKETGDVYAMKTLRKEQSRKHRAGAAEDERDVLANANSPWIPRLQYAFQDNSHLYLVMELCAGGALAGLLARRGAPLAERDAAFYVAEVAHALKALHAMGYVHRDVNPNNILLDRCGHVKLGDLGSCGRLSGEGGGAGGVTPDYVAPELLAPDCRGSHAGCLLYCRGVLSASISAVDYWSLGVVAFELVTLRRPFSSGDDDSVTQVLNNIQKYERDPDSTPPFEPLPAGPSAEWRSLVAGLLRVQPAQRYTYLDTLRHPALQHTAPINIRDQVPPWVPCVRGPEDAAYLPRAPREPRAPDAAPFRARPPFAGQLPFIGYSYVAPEESEESTMSSGFNASHDCTAIDMATFKSAEKLAAMRGREVVSLQHKLATAEAAAADAVSRARRDADAEAERTRARLQAEITALTLQLRRLERQVEVEKEERMALQRTNQELNSRISERNNAALAEMERERDVLKEEVGRMESQIQQLHAECARAQTAADAAKMTQQHYKDTIAKERALRRQTLSGGDETREVAARLASAEAAVARETRGKAEAEARLVGLDADNTTLRAENEALKVDNATLQRDLDATRKELLEYKNSYLEKQRVVDTSSEQLKIAQQDLAQERVRVTALNAQVQELERSIEEAARRETSLEEQCARTEARLLRRLDDAQAQAAAALQDHDRHREKVKTLEQLVRRLESEVSALERRVCPECVSRTSAEREHTPRTKHERDKMAADGYSDTESVDDGPHVANAQLTVLKEQLERAEATLQARADEIASLKQEARSANLARWRKEKEYNELSLEAKSSARELKRLEERLSAVLEAKKTAEQKALELQKEIATLRPEHERASKEATRLREQMDKMQKTLATAQAEVDRSRNDIRKLKSELTYSERRRLHAEEQEELSSRERALVREELQQLRARADDLEQNNKALQEACSLLEEQLTDLEKLADHHELKNKDLESELQRLRSDLTLSRSKLAEAERQSSQAAGELNNVARQHEEARDEAAHAHCQIKLLQERLQNREQRVSELEARYAELESSHLAREAALSAAARRVRELQEEAATLRTTAHQHHAAALQLQASLAETQEELSCARESAAAAAAWWRTRETKADATLRQQAKLIDFLQAKVEEATRKKCSLSNKLFGRSGRRSPASPPLRRANRELREEVEKLRSKLSALNGEDCPPTPKREKPKQKRSINGRRSNEFANGDGDDFVTIVWSDGGREQMRASLSDGNISLHSLNTSGRTFKGRLLSTQAPHLSHGDSNRAFMVKLEESPRDNEVAVVCKSVTARADWIAKLNVVSPSKELGAGYVGRTLCSLRVPPNTALYLAEDAVLIGGPDGLHSLRGPIQLCGPTEPERALAALALCGARVAVSGAAGLRHAALRPLASAARRDPQLRAAVALQPVSLPDNTAPHRLVALTGDDKEAAVAVAAAACGRRVFVLRAADAELRAARALTVDRAPHALLLTARALYVAGDKPLKIPLPAGALEAFAMDEPIIAAAARKHSPPKEILLIRENPLEILLCYSELGVFLDENGKRTRHEDPKWSAAVHAWAFVHPFLYVIGEDRVTIVYLTEEVYRSPPCTCDTTSLASTASDCYLPQIFNLKINEPYLLGTAPNGVIIRSKDGEKYNVSILEGMAAFRSVGASIESLSTNSDIKGSSTDLAQSMTDLSDRRAPQDVSQESIEETTGFLADIRKRAQQLRNKNRKEHTSQVSSDDVIKKILMTEVGIKRMSNGRKSPETSSEFDSDSTEADEHRSASTKDTAEVCAEMFTRQVRFE
ncbi:citron rho-interacting kinase-like isoform X2 [Plodia interpunctella]|uniref:citron rho-interacting kinase-like isoform X2 n=1 Tax=Plodia interpunctella TaxID=58824 RepID=UPI0023688806|nr:citron rho-interacting kinase-like isoform X2 [Plodia interpunctella]